MFDWNDEELTNIIWDEAGESDDHIVPFPEASEDYCKKKEWSQEAGTHKPNEQKPAEANVKLHSRKRESSSKFDPTKGTSASRFDMESWSNLSNAVKTDQDSLDTSVSNNLTEITKFDSSTGEAAQPDQESEIFQSANEGKEHGDFVDYGWANIGSFDDLDRIFSNDDSIFGNASLGNADEIWCSSKDLTTSSVKSFPVSEDSPTFGLGALGDTSGHFEIKTEYVQEDDMTFSLRYGGVNNSASRGLQNACHVEYPVGENKSIVKEQTGVNIVGKNTPAANSQRTAQNVTAPFELADKVYKQKKVLKNRKKHAEINELKINNDLYGNWSPSGNLADQFKNQFVHPIMQSSPSSVLSQQRQLQGSESLPYKQIANPFVPPSAYGSITNPYSAMPVLSHVQSGEFNRQPLLSGYDVSPRSMNTINKLADPLAKPQTMTPQEKIEKLRRRQQLQAMLAIQKQKQQFGCKVPSSDHSTQKCSQENQVMHIEGSDIEIEDLSTLPSFEPHSPIEQDDSSAISLAVTDYSLEDTIYRLQDIIAKLDVRIRLCIRDSLFRLAQSAMQRHYASDTSSTNNNSRDEQVFLKEETINHSRSVKISEVETETNPIDRTVAHLLFRRPPELSGKHPDTPESPVSTKLPSDNKAMGMTKLCLPEAIKNKQKFSQQTSQNSFPLGDSQPVSQNKSSLCLETLENVSNSGAVDDSAREAEASQ